MLLIPNCVTLYVPDVALLSIDPGVPIVMTNDFKYSPVNKAEKSRKASTNSVIFLTLFFEF